MDYGTLKSELLGILGREPSALAFQLANSELNQVLRLVAMEITVTAVATSQQIPSPTDFIEVRSLKDAADNYFSPISHENRATDAPACRFTVGNGTIYLTGAPADAAAFELIYVAELAELVADGDTNAATLNALEAYTYTVLKHHSVLMRDNGGVEFWAAKSSEAVAMANDADMKKRHHGGTVKAVVKGMIA